MVGAFFFILTGAAIFILVLWSVVKRSDYAADVRPSAERAAVAKNKQWNDRGDADNRWSDWVPLVAAIALFCAQGTILATIDHTQEPTIRYLVGTSATPAALLTVREYSGIPRGQHATSSPGAGLLRVPVLD